MRNKVLSLFTLSILTVPGLEMTSHLQDVTEWPVINVTHRDVISYHNSSEPEQENSGQTTSTDIRNSILNCLGIFLNSWALAGLIRHKEFGKQYKTLVISLTVGGLLFNVMAALQVILQTAVVLPSSICYSVLGLVVTFYFSSLYFVLTIGLDRCFAIFAPFKYRTQPKSRARVMVCVVCVMSVTASLVLFVGGQQRGMACYPFSIITEAGLYFWGISISVVTLGCVIIYGAIVIEIWLSRGRSAVVHPAFVRPQVSHVHARAVRKVTFQSVALVFWICLTDLPTGLYFIYINAAKVDKRGETGSVRFNVLTAPPFLSALFNPLIILVQIDAFRAVQRKIASVRFPWQSTRQSTQ